MDHPFTPLPATEASMVQINSGEWNEYITPVNSSKFVADIIFPGNWAQVEFKNATDLKLVRENFGSHINNWLAQLRYRNRCYDEPIDFRAYYRLTD
jgi:hypothetical protein